MAVEGQKHIMLSCELVGAALHTTTRTHMSVVSLAHSCTSLMHSYGYVVYADQWDGQATIQRLNEWLIARGYVTWFDLTNMKGSTMDAMSDAIEGADVMLYGVSLAYKESANCRLEASCSRICLELLNVSSARLTYILRTGQLRPPAGAGHDPTDDAGEL